MVRPHKHAYDGIIVYYMVKQQIIYTYDKYIGKFSNERTFTYWFMRPIEYDPLPQTPTSLYNKIERIRKKNRWPKVSWSTLQKYLKMLVDKHVLIKDSKVKRRYNEKHYRLSDSILHGCLDYLFWHHTKFDHGPIGSKPYSNLLIIKLHQELNRRRVRP